MRQVEQQVEDEFWESVHEIAQEVESWPEWKKEGWAVIDRRSTLDKAAGLFSYNQKDQ